MIAHILPNLKQCVSCSFPLFFIISKEKEGGEEEVGDEKLHSSSSITIRITCVVVSAKITSCRSKPCRGGFKRRSNCGFKGLQWPSSMVHRGLHFDRASNCV